MQEQLQDAEIIQQVLKGRQQAYALLVERYQHYVFTLVLRYVPVREEAEEVAQDVFVKAYRYLADFQGKSKFSTWLYTIVNTTCISFLRTKKERAVLLEQDDMSAIADRSGFGEDMKLAIDRRSDKELLERAIKTLPKTDGQVVSLFYQHDQSLEEIGTILGMTAGNVKVRLFRARQKLKEILQPQMT